MKVSKKAHEPGLRCSFCQKAQEVVGKLISSPSDHPRAYIRDECVAVCNSIFEDDRVAGTPEEKFPVRLETKYMQGVVYMSGAEMERLRDSLDEILGRPSAESPAQSAQKPVGSVEQ